MSREAKGGAVRPSAHPGTAKREPRDTLDELSAAQLRTAIALIRSVIAEYPNLKGANRYVCLAISQVALNRRDLRCLRVASTLKAWISQDLLDGFFTYDQWLMANHPQLLRRVPYGFDRYNTRVKAARTAWLAWMLTHLQQRERQLQRVKA